MICKRCEGMMYVETVPRIRGPRLLLWACFMCGDRTDETIEFHRIFRRPETHLERMARVERQIRTLMSREELELMVYGGEA